MAREPGGEGLHQTLALVGRQPVQRGQALASQGEGELAIGEQRHRGQVVRGAQGAVPSQGAIRSQDAVRSQGAVRGQSPVAGQLERQPPPAQRLTGPNDLLASGARSWPELIAGGSFEISGDAFLALGFASPFRLPVALDPAT